jgi:hypothetical protein
MAGFEVIGTLAGGESTVRVIPMQIGETCYQGQLLEDGSVAAATAHVGIADAESEAKEDDQPIIGVAVGAVNSRTEFNSTYKGQVCTYTTTQATIAAFTDVISAATMLVAQVFPNFTRIKGPIYATAFGTALTELTNTVASAGGTVVTHAAITAAFTDALSTIYCRKGANKGQYRVITTSATTSQTVTIPFPYAIAVGDVFVATNGKLGKCRLTLNATANYIDGMAGAAQTNYYDIRMLQLNLEESGKEWAEFVFMYTADGCD